MQVFFPKEEVYIFQEKKLLFRMEKRISAIVSKRAKC